MAYPGVRRRPSLSLLRCDGRPPRTVPHWHGPTGSINHSPARPARLSACLTAGQTGLVMTSFPSAPCPQLVRLIFSREPKALIKQIKTRKKLASPAVPSRLPRGAALAAIRRRGGRPGPSVALAGLAKSVRHKRCRCGQVELLGALCVCVCMCVCVKGGGAGRFLFQHSTYCTVPHCILAALCASQGE